MNIKRIATHLFVTRWQVKRAFDSGAMSAIEKAIKASEAQHAGQIRFVVEGGLDGWPLLKDQTARERAIEVFSQLRIWDTEHNNGLLIYLLLADRAVEIVADRGIHAKANARDWNEICRQMEAAFRQSEYEGGALLGLQSVTRHLVAHFPANGLSPNELPDTPVIL